VAITYGHGPGHNGRGRWPPTGSHRHRRTSGDLLLVGSRRHPAGRAPTATATKSSAPATDATTTTATATARAARLHFGGHRKAAPFHMGHQSQRHHGGHQPLGFGLNYV